MRILGSIILVHISQWKTIMISSNNIKTIVRKIPIVGTALIKIKNFLQGKNTVIFKNSAQYWEERYRLGGTSGAGSYGRLAQFKANFINDYVKKNSIRTVVEFGCGDGAQLALMEYENYIGFDVSSTSIQLCKQKFKKETFVFFLVDGNEYHNLPLKDLALSLDVIYHLVEDTVFEKHMKKLFSSSYRFVIIYAYSFNKLYESQHERGRDFLSWIESNISNWSLQSIVRNNYPYDPSNPEDTSQSDFFVFVRSS